MREIILPIAPNAVKRLQKHGLLPKVVLYLKELAGTNLEVLAEDFNLTVIGKRVSMDLRTFNKIFKMSNSRAETQPGKERAVLKTVLDTLNQMLEEEDNG